VSVTYTPMSRQCCDARPSFRGAVVRRGHLHGECDGIYRGGPVGPYRDGDPCMCECHTPEGLPDWLRPQEGHALAAAIQAERHIGAITADLEERFPVLPSGRIADVAEWVRAQGWEPPAAAPGSP